MESPSSHRDERGATSVEYALMIGLITVVIVGAVTLFGIGVRDLFFIPAGVLNP
ncbi:Flp family type IVb pilin [Nocardioides seonyuensis]|uniref:Flp family type IVb pilin n=1 Tax=Nocardioides seonyuensis TaxID=2518371 RepID=A0A4P7IAQ0_9ACTN|nr:Flp family type IVb pilin [Nocardioides seonyuensis]QBX54088.1 Flp family type IVb pilin [Nocardioides seonyuensis]